jgi:hypothetical protein
MSDFHMDIIWTGVVNSSPVSMKGELSRTDQGTLAFHGKFDAIPDSFTPAALSNSGICYNCGNGALALGRATPIHEFTGGDSTAFRGFRVSQDGRVIGEVEVHGLTRRISAGKYVNATILRGTYQGPTDIVELGPYMIPLQKKESGLLQGEYRQNIKTASGAVLLIEATTHYKWAETHGLQALAPANDLLLSMDYLRHSFQDHELSFEVRANVAASIL